MRLVFSGCWGRSHLACPEASVGVGSVVLSVAGQGTLIEQLSLHMYRKTLRTPFNSIDSKPPNATLNRG